MSALTVSFDVAPDIMLGLESGKYVRYGGVIRDTAGHIVKHLEEKAVVENAASAAAAAMEAAAAPAASIGKRILWFVVKNKKVLICAALATAAVGVTVYFVHKHNEKKKREKQELTQKLMLDFQASMADYLTAVRNQELSEQHIDAVVASLDQIKKHRHDCFGDGNFTVENAELLSAMITELSQKYVLVNATGEPEGEETPIISIFDFKDYLAAQKKSLQMA